MLLNRRPLPKSLPAKQKLGLQLFLLGAGIFSISVILTIIYFAAGGLAENLPGILGNGTTYIFLFVLLALVLRQPISKWLNSQKLNNLVTRDMITSAKESEYANQKVNKSWLGTFLKACTMLGGLALFCHIHIVLAVKLN